MASRVVRDRGQSRAPFDELGRGATGARSRRAASAVVLGRQAAAVALDAAAVLPRGVRGLLLPAR